ncbi:MAG: hypothetical protein NW226_21550 [Microscillaceae bacterium]|nr:hypothetical protein [Microscillaceae bacterium]
MKNYLLVLICLPLLLGCETEQESLDRQKKDQVAGLNNTPSNTHKNNKQSSQKSQLNQTHEKDSVKKTKTEQSESGKLRPQLRLLQSLSKGSKIEFAPLDLQVIKEDTTILSKEIKFEIFYATSCLNDSLIAQEMYDYGRTNTKSYLISHNYKTELSIKVDGVLKGNKIIHKDLFINKLDRNFLDKSILKHPRFVKFNEETNEAVFEFIVGVPNTDWLVLAGINLNDAGNIRIIDIVMPPGL